MQALINYSWPGNIRELHNILERAALLAEGSRITPKDLPQALCSPPSAPQADTNGVFPALSTNSCILRANETPPYSPRGKRSETTPGGAEIEAGKARPPDEAEAGNGSAHTLAEAEAELIRRTLGFNRGNKSRTAKMLGISREGLRIKMARLGLTSA